VSYSSSSSVQESASPPTPSDSYAEPHLRDQTRPSVFSDTSHRAENGQISLYSATRSPRQNLDTPEASLASKSGSTLLPDILGILPARSQSSDTAASAPPLDPRLSSTPGIAFSDPRLSLDDAGSAHLSHLSATMSDGAAGIGLSMLQGFLSSNIDGYENDRDENDEDDSDPGFSSQSDVERTSLEETVDGFPAPPTQIPTPSSRATSSVLDAHRTISPMSEYSEDGDGGSFYDNYRYSRLSISSKMSKSSGYTATNIPLPIPAEPPPPVGHSQDSHVLASRYNSTALSSNAVVREDNAISNEPGRVSKVIFPVRLVGSE
jgi:hypothetical protein